MGSDIDLTASSSLHGSVRMECDESTVLNPVPGRFNNPFSDKDSNVDNEALLNDIVKRTTNPLPSYGNILGNMESHIPLTLISSQPLKPQQVLSTISSQPSELRVHSTISTQPMAMGNVWTNFEQSVPMSILPGSSVLPLHVDYVDPSEAPSTIDPIHSKRHPERSEEASPMVGVVQQNPVVSH